MLQQGADLSQWIKKHKSILLQYTSAHSYKLYYIQNVCARGHLLVICWFLRHGASKWTIEQAGSTVLQNWDKVTVGVTALTKSACAGNNLQLITCNCLSQTTSTATDRYPTAEDSCVSTRSFLYSRRIISQRFIYSTIQCLNTIFLSRRNYFYYTVL